MPKMDRSPEQEVLFSAPIWTDLAKHVKAGLTAKLKLLQRRVLDHKHCPTMLAAWHRFVSFKETKTVGEILTFPTTGPARKVDVVGMTQIQMDDLQQRVSDYCTATE